MIVPSRTGAQNLKLAVIAAEDEMFSSAADKIVL